MNEIIVETENLQKTYMDKKALNKVSLLLSKGEAVAFIGANGAGKSTLLNIILGLIRPDLPPDGGNCRVFGVDSHLISPRMRCRIGCIADNAQPVPWASLHDLSSLYRSLYPKWDNDRFSTLSAKWNLNRYATFGSFSMGQKRLVEIALTLSFYPDLLILDEPFNNLDPLMRHDVHTLLQEEREKYAITILYSTHILSEVSKIAQRVIILTNGSISYDSPLDNVCNQLDTMFMDIHNKQREGTIE